MLPPVAADKLKALLTQTAPMWVWIVIAVTVGVMMAADMPDRLSAVETAVEELQGAAAEDSRRLKRIECFVESMVLEEDPVARGCWRL